MPRPHHRRAAGTFALAAAIAIPLTATATPEDAPSPASAEEALQFPSRSFEAVAKPSDVRELGFAVRGKIADLKVEPGEHVSTGHLLMRLDDAVTREAAELARIRAEDTTQVRSAERAVEFRREDLRILREGRERGGTTEKEVREAEFRYEQAKIEAEAAAGEREEAAAALRREMARIDEMRMTSPIEGVVVEVSKRPGETVDELNPVITVVQTDPLWLDVNIPTLLAMELETGQNALVRWQDLEDRPHATGRIIFKSPIGHGGARMLTVRIEVPNPDGLPSGLHADVAFVDEPPDIDEPGEHAEKPADGRDTARRTQ